VQENLGHHTAAFTLDIYAHITEQMEKESSERMDKFIKGISNL
jgi:integrase